MKSKDENLPISEVSFDTGDYERSPYSWMMRPCEWYKQEFKDCKSISARFHQYFIYGTAIDCSDWKRDYDNCIKFRKEKDSAALDNVIQSELRRKEFRMKESRANDVWEYRTEPPKDWKRPLPEWILERDKSSYLKAHTNANKNSGDTQ